MQPAIEKKLEIELKSFAARHFETPAECRNPEQVRFYIHELRHKIKTLKAAFNYVPDAAYQLLAAYNARKNSLAYPRLRNTYR